MGHSDIGFLRLVKGFIKLGLCLLYFLLFLIGCLFINLLYVFFKSPFRKRLISKWIRIFDLCLIRLINIKVKVSAPEGAAASNGHGAFLVSNHLGYVDGLVLGSVFPLIYVSKSELRRWPVIGLMTELSGTLYIDRNRKNHIASYIELMAEVLKEGANILFFPEGTSSNGEGLQPFKSAFFEAPLAAGAPIVPISLIYRAVDRNPVTKENRDLVYWYGDMTFADHFFKLLLRDSVEVEVKIHPPVPLGEQQDRSLLRKRASESARNSIWEGIRQSKA